MAQFRHISPPGSFRGNKTASDIQQAGSLRIISWNINSLNVPEKSIMTLREIHKLGADVCFIQETHFTASQIPRFHDHRYPVAYHSCVADSKTKGVSILIKQGVLRTLRDRWTDDAGRLLFIKGQIGSQTCTLATLYSSNSAQVQFLEQALQCLQDFTEGILILGGDFNLTLDPTLDSTRGVPSIPFAALRRIKRNLHAYQLIDTCRALSPAGKDFTHYSPPHGCYSRIDLFFTKHDLHRVTKVSIGSIHISDHIRPCPHTNGTTT